MVVFLKELYRNRSKYVSPRFESLVVYSIYFFLIVSIQYQLSFSFQSKFQDLPFIFAMNLRVYLIYVTEQRFTKNWDVYFTKKMLKARHRIKGIRQNTIKIVFQSLIIQKIITLNIPAMQNIAWINTAIFCLLVFYRV